MLLRICDAHLQMRSMPERVLCTHTQGGYSAQVTLRTASATLYTSLILESIVRVNP